MKIEFHADDYGLFPSQTQSMDKLIQYHAINAVSIMPNGLFSSDTPTAFLYRDDILYNVHISLFEGKCCVDRTKIPLLVDNDGNLNLSFTKLFLYSFLPQSNKNRQALKQQLKLELKAQLESCISFCPSLKDGLRIDGHAHFHIIPIVFEALTEVLVEGHYKVEYIRIPKEDISFYQGLSIPYINRVKTFLLNFMIDYDFIHYKKNLNVINYRPQASYCFFGVLLSGVMTYDSVKLLIERARKHGFEEIEVLFHPGTELAQEEIKALTNENDIAFWLSENRQKEFDAVSKIANEMKKD